MDINNCNDKVRKLSNHIPLRGLVLDSPHMGGVDLVVVERSCRPDDEDGPTATRSQCAGTAWVVPSVEVVRVQQLALVECRSGVWPALAWRVHEPTVCQGQVPIDLGSVLWLW